MTMAIMMEGMSWNKDLSTLITRTKKGTRSFKTLAPSDSTNQTLNFWN